MRVARSFDELLYDGRALVTIGTFDGVHRGHRFLLEQAKQRAAEHGYGFAIVTFDPCPAVVLRPSIGRYQLLGAEQKLEKLAGVGPDLIAMLDFTPELSTLSAHEFMDALEARVTIAEIWMGEDFRFGRDRSGDMHMLVERGRESRFSLHVVARGMDDKASISSSRIREALHRGDLGTATALLGYPFARDLVEAGGSRGIWLDGARASLAVSVAPHLALPLDGMYAVMVLDGSAEQASLAAVSAGREQDQLQVLDTGTFRTPCAVEFIEYLCTAEAYATDAAGWERKALQSVAGWTRPVYQAAGNY